MGKRAVTIRIPNNVATFIENELLEEIIDIGGKEVTHTKKFARVCEEIFMHSFKNISVADNEGKIIIKPNGDE